MDYLTRGQHRGQLSGLGNDSRYQHTSHAMAQWNSTDLNWKIFNDVNQRRSANVTDRSRNASDTGTVQSASPATATVSSLSENLSSLPGRPTKTTTTTAIKSFRRRTTPPILSGNESTPRPWRGVEQPGIRSNGQGAVRASDADERSFTQRPLHRGRSQNPVATTARTTTSTMSPIIASATAILPTVFMGQPNNNNSHSSHVIAGQLDVITSSPKELLLNDTATTTGSNRTSLYNHYVDTVTGLATNNSSSSHLATTVTGADGVLERSRKVVATKMEAIVSSLANFTSTSESSELLLDTDNGSRNMGGGGSVGGGGGGDASDRDVELNFRGGSNFMLLLEDFGEYFYNFNGTSDASGGGVGGGGDAAYSNFNGSYDLQTNCSLANSTCGVEALPSKWTWLW